jgi:hypothetical protein
MHEYCGLLLDEAEYRGVDVIDLRTEHDTVGDVDTSVVCFEDEWISERIDDILDRIRDAGYPYIEEDDTLLIWPKGVDLPAEWQDD